MSGCGPEAEGVDDGLGSGVGSGVGSEVDPVTDGYFPPVSTLNVAPVGQTTAPLLGTHKAGPRELLVETLPRTSLAPVEISSPPGRALLAPVPRSAL